MNPNRKVVVVGAGDVGATFAFALLQEGLAEEIAILDANPERAQGQALDLAHGLPFVTPVRVYAGDARDYAEASVVVITAGARQRPGETRLQLVQRNVQILAAILRDLMAAKSQATVVVVANPVDVLTRVALEITGWPRHRIFGSGTVLDSARFRFLLSRHCGVDVRNVHAYMLGEHGDSEFAAWSMTHLAGIPVAEYCRRCGRCSDGPAEREALVDEVRRSAYHIIESKGSTCYAIALALVRIVGAVLRHERSVLTVSTRLEGEFGLTGDCLGVPCVVGRDGVERVLETRLPRREQAALERSAAVLRETAAAIRVPDAIRDTP